MCSQPLGKTEEDYSRPACTTLRILLVLVVMSAAAGGCALKMEKARVQPISESYPPGTIISAAAGGTISFEQMIDDLADAGVVYVG